MRRDPFSGSAWLSLSLRAFSRVRRNGRPLPGIFSKLPPLGPQHNARVVLVNRRDYLGAAPHTPKELATLQEAAAEPDASVAQATLLGWMKERARELYDLLVWLVETEHIPPAGTPEGNPGTGGIVLVGWSFGTILVTALLANIASFSKETGVALSSFVQRVVFHGERWIPARGINLRDVAFPDVLIACVPDAPYIALGFPPILNPYNPLADPTIAPEEATRAFAVWVSGYYDHGDLQSMDSLERRTHLESPPPTVSTLSEEERANSFCPGPGSPVPRSPSRPGPAPSSRAPAEGSPGSDGRCGINAPSSRGRVAPPLLLVHADA